ncbi:LysR family transcriptional regulator [Georgenia sp. AZ-5]|uniref:LysR family transcriptional regulator n=1 Tax=Georgenia sp. AZ-5 TaxID=3367526 RepID=UPI0037547333
MYTLEQLRGFVAVAEEGNFGRAAERLRMTQPPLSRQVQKLERDVGVELFERTHRGVRLTPGGQVFLEEARRILGLTEAAPLLARSVARGAAGTLRIGFTAVTAQTVLGAWIRAAGQHMPDVDLVLSEMVSRQQVDALLAGDLDVGVARGVPRSELLEVRLVHAESLVLAAPRDHPLAALGRAPRVEEIAEHEVVTYSPVEARYLHEAVVAVFSQGAITPRYVQHVNQVNSVVALVDAGVGVALVPESTSVFQHPGLVYLPVEGVTPRTVRAHCVWRRDNVNPVLAALLRLVLPARPVA